MAERAVWSEPVSDGNSLLNRENTGNFLCFWSKNAGGDGVLRSFQEGYLVKVRKTEQGIFKRYQEISVPVTDGDQGTASNIHPYC
jgi:hypothetical protein